MRPNDIEPVFWVGLSPASGDGCPRGQANQGSARLCIAICDGLWVPLAVLGEDITKLD